jgi:hypothetical protein
MEKLKVDNTLAIELQKKLLKTNYSFEKYERLCREFEYSLKNLPPEGKQLNENGFLIPWKNN